MSNYFQLIIYGFFVLWIIFSVYYIIRFSKLKNSNKYNPYIYNSIPSVFTAIGVLGTFIGIFIGLYHFNVNDINNSIPKLLEGMKTAFLTSIIGISLSLIFRFIGQLVLRDVEKSEPPKQTSELSALSEIIDVLKSSREISISGFELINRSLIGDSDNSLSIQFTKLINQQIENHKELLINNKLLKNVESSLIGNESTSLLTQFEKLRGLFNDNFKELKKANNYLGGDNKISIISQFKNFREEQKDYSRKQNENIYFIAEQVKSNSKVVQKKFDEFSILLAKNNTEALVEVMKIATESFNEQMSTLIEKLVQENFKELNNSVKSLNDWQKENKVIISKLTEQFKKVSNEFEIASESISLITENTSKLTDENSHLTKLIKELQTVMVDDTKFQDIVNKLTGTIELVKTNTEVFDKTTNKLNKWILNEHNFKQSVDILISRLNEIEKIKDINGEFWNNTKKNMERGVSIISNASGELRNNLDSISEEFTGQLNQTLTSLDELIQRLVKHYYE